MRDVRIAQNCSIIWTRYRCMRWECRQWGRRQRCFFLAQLLLLPRCTLHCRANDECQSSSSSSTSCTTATLSARFFPRSSAAIIAVRYINYCIGLCELIRNYYYYYQILELRVYVQWQDRIPLKPHRPVVLPVSRPKPNSWYSAAIHHRTPKTAGRC